MPCIPPEFAVSGKRFPPKTFPGPPGGEIQCRHYADRLSCPGFPRFRDLPCQDRLCRRKDRSPLAVYYITVHDAKQTEKASRKKKKSLGTKLFSRWSNLLVKFRGGNGDSSTRKHKNRTRGEPTNAAGLAFFSSARIARNEDSGPTHFGMRNSGIGICISSYMFIYWAKSR